MSFAIGDKVDYHGHEAIVRAVIPPDHCEVEFMQKDLCPPIMKVPVNELLFLGPVELDEYDNPGLLPTGINLLKPMSGNHKLGKPNPNVICPVCETPWHETPHNTGIWYDCIKCGKTKEAILKT
jgi:hypothetical protein